MEVTCRCNKTLANTYKTEILSAWGGRMFLEVAGLLHEKKTLCL